MHSPHAISIVVIGTIVAAAGSWFIAPWVFAERLPPGASLGEHNVSGLPFSAIETVVASYERELLERPVTLRLRHNKEITRTLREVGVTVDTAATAAELREQSMKKTLADQPVAVTFHIDEAAIAKLAEREFAKDLTLPQNALLTIIPGTRSLRVSPSARGEAIDVVTLAADIQWRVLGDAWQEPIDLAIVSAAPSVNEGEVGAAQIFAEKLLREGLPISDGVTTWTIQAGTLERLLRFVPVPDPGNPQNEVLGVTVDSDALAQYLEKTIAPEVNQEAKDARFERQENRVTQFTAPQAGKVLNIEASQTTIATALLNNQPQASVVIDVTEPSVREIADVASLGINELLATGTSDYVGSPANRVHNIVEGVKRYHGLLIKPGQEFSFNEYLGPVDGAHGFKPELVIKKNVTIPEFGGGLCQVSTTIFRAATYAGLKITARRNHAYPVKYYGTPGFDATIYPPYTDLRFVNNTPGYILIQAKQEGTHLAFEFWGTKDGREVSVDGPHPYGRTPDGAVKATLAQKVIKNGELIIDDTFYSRYQSPNLFPKPNASPQPTPPPVSAPTPTPAPSKKPAPPSR